MVKENQKVFNTLLVCVDIGLVAASILITSFCIQTIQISDTSGNSSVWNGVFPQIVLFPSYVFCFYFAGLYGSRRYNRFSQELLAIVYCSGAILISALVFFYCLGVYGFYRTSLLISCLCFTLLDGAARYFLRLLLRQIRKKGYNLKFLLLVGGGELAKQFVKKVSVNPQYGYRFSGCLADDTGGKKLLAGIPVLGPTSSLKLHIPNKGVDEVVIALELKEYSKIPRLIAQCEKNGVKANIVPAYYKYIPSNPRMDEFDEIPVMVLRKIPLTNPFYAAIKRLADIAGSLICIVLFSPVMLVSWAVIRHTTGEKAIYKQERVGYNLRTFTMYKFRTILAGEDVFPQWTQKKDKRRTKFGAVIRKLSIDELPQFFNVLKGEMSIVGPRPELAAFVNQFKESIPRYMVRHQVKPGITGWAQIHNLRGDTSIKDRINNDIYYIEKWSPALDLQIIIRTILYAFYNPNE